MPKIPQAAAGFSIAYSPKLLMTLNCLHILALAAAWLNALPLYLKLLVSVLLLISWRWQYIRQRAAPILLSYRAEGWFLSLQADDDQAITLKPSSVISRMLTVLHYNRKAEKRLRTLLIVNDALPADAYRRLTVLLKISGLQHSQPDK